MTFTVRQRLAQPFARRIPLVLGIGLLLGFAGPFGSSPPLDAPVRYAFWIAMALVGYAAALAAEKLVPEPFTSRSELRLATVAIASALPLTFVAAWGISIVRPGHVHEPLHLPALFAASAAVQLAIVFTLLRTPVVAAGSVPAASEVAPYAPPSARSLAGFPPALLSRLPSRLGRDIVALEAEDHYLRVHTAVGSDLILMRLSDAIAAIPPDLGFQVHRSWWVAHDAISEITRSDGRSHLRLKNGLTVPVGRTYSAAVRSRAVRALS